LRPICFVIGLLMYEPGRSINKLVSSLGNMIQRVQHSGESIDHSGLDLTTSSNRVRQSAADLNKMTAQMQGGTGRFRI